MNRYMFLKTKSILAIVNSDGMVTFHNEEGFPVKDPVNIMTQESTVDMLKEQGYAEVSPL